MPPVSFIETFSPSRPSREALPKGLPAYYRVSVENSRGAWPGVGKHNCRGGYECWSPNLVRMDPFGKPTRWVDLSSGGPKDVEFTLTPNISWINTDITHGRLQRDAGTDTRFYVSIDWSKVPKKDGEEPYSTGGGVLIAGSDGTNVTLGVPITTAIPPPDDFQGFVEGDGYVVMEAAHFARNESASGYAFEDIEWYGRTLSGLEMLPVSNVNHTLGTGPSLSYDFWSTGASGNTKNVEVTIQIGPTFNFMLGKKLAFGLQVDDGEARMFTPIPDTTEVEGAGTVPADWPNIVSSEIRNVTGTFELGGGGAGEHSVTVYGITSGIIVERIWVDFAGIVERGYSYLGPPESRRV